MPSLDNWGSGAPDLRYVNFGLALRAAAVYNVAPRLGGKNSPLYVVLGPEFAFNHFHGARATMSG